MRPFRLHPEAEAEALDAAAFIKADDASQSSLFIQALEDALIWARTYPLIFRRFNGDYRKVKLGKFRYC